jgi:hypothetical protein
LPACRILFFVTCRPSVRLGEEQHQMTAYSDLLQRYGDEGVGYVACPRGLVEGTFVALRPCNRAALRSTKARLQQARPSPPPLREARFSIIEKQPTLAACARSFGKAIG